MPAGDPSPLKQEVAARKRGLSFGTWFGGLGPRARAGLVGGLAVALVATLVIGTNAKVRDDLVAALTTVARLQSAAPVATPTPMAAATPIAAATTVWAWGHNSDGQLGDGTLTQRPTPVQVQVPGLSGVTAIAAGVGHTVVLRGDGTVWTWGSNSDGQLGRTATDPLSFQVSSLSGVTAIAVGWQHTAALKGDGTVWAWGNNASGQLGDGTTTQRPTPVQASGLSGVTAIAAGYHHTVALSGDGTVWAWGNNASGQLGDGTTAQGTTPVQVPGLSGVTAIAAGIGHTVALKGDGTVWAWGSNHEGLLGDGTTTPNRTPVQVSGLSGVTAIAAGSNHTVALKGEGTAWAWGRNHDGQLGVGNRTLTPNPTPVQVLSLSGVTAIGAGFGHTVALRADGTVWSWGSNSVGQLGDGTTTRRATPVQVSSLSGVTSIAVGTNHTVALALDRAERPAASGPAPTTAPLASFDDRFGFLVPCYRVGCRARYELRTESDPTALAGIDAELTLAVSPDGRRVAYVRGRTPGRQQLRLFDVPSRADELVLDLEQPEERVETGTSGSRLVWARDGSGLAYAADVPVAREGIHLPARYSALRTVDLETRQVRELARLTSGAYLVPLAWDRSAGVIAAYEYNTFAATHYLLVGDRGVVSRTPLSSGGFGGGLGVPLEVSPDARYVLGQAVNPPAASYVRVWPLLDASRSFDLQTSERELGAPRFRPGADEIGGLVGSSYEIWDFSGRRRVIMAHTASGVLSFRHDGSAGVVARLGADGTISAVLVDLIGGGTRAWLGDHLYAMHAVVLTARPQP